MTTGGETARQRSSMCKFMLGAAFKTVDIIIKKREVARAQRAPPF